MCNSLPTHGLYSPWNSLEKNIGVGTLSFLQVIFPTQGSSPGLPHRRWILYQLNHKASPRISEQVAYPFSSGSSNPGIEPGSPALQADSLPTELPRKPKAILYVYIHPGLTQYISSWLKTSLLCVVWQLYSPQDSKGPLHRLQRQRRWSKEHSKPMPVTHGFKSQASSWPASRRCFTGQNKEHEMRQNKTSLSVTPVWLR